MSHASASLLNAYLREGEPDPACGHGFSIVDPQEYEALPVTLASGVTFLHMALAAWNSIDVDHVRTDALAQFADKTGIRTVFK